MPRFALAMLLTIAGLGAVEVNLTASAASVTEAGSVMLTATRSSNVGILTVPVVLTIGVPPCVNPTQLPGFGIWRNYCASPHDDRLRTQSDPDSHPEDTRASTI